jgi:hypothetical protein
LTASVLVGLKSVQGLWKIANGIKTGAKITGQVANNTKKIAGHITKKPTNATIKQIFKDNLKRSVEKGKQDYFVGNALEAVFGVEVFKIGKDVLENWDESDYFTVETISTLLMVGATVAMHKLPQIKKAIENKKAKVKIEKNKNGNYEAKISYNKESVSAEFTPEGQIKIRTKSNHHAGAGETIVQTDHGIHPGNVNEIVAKVAIATVATNLINVVDDIKKDIQTLPEGNDKKKLEQSLDFIKETANEIRVSGDSTKVADIQKPVKTVYEVGAKTKITDKTTAQRFVKANEELQEKSNENIAGAVHLFTYYNALHEEDYETAFVANSE